jgi:hypothetical protein
MTENWLWLIILRGYEFAAELVAIAEERTDFQQKRQFIASMSTMLNAGDSVISVSIVSSSTRRNILR